MHRARDLLGGHAAGPGVMSLGAQGQGNSLQPGGDSCPIALFTVSEWPSTCRCPGTGRFLPVPVCPRPLGICPRGPP